MSPSENAPSASASARLTRGGVLERRTAHNLAAMQMRCVSLLALAAVTIAGAPARAQRGVQLDLGGALLAGGDEIGYLRTMQLLDSSAKGSVSLQPMGRATERAWRGSVSGPWASRFSGAKRERSFTLPVLGELQYALLRGDAQAWYHTDFPAGEAPGVVWAGRGLTTAVQGGARVEGRWWRAQVAPVAFIAENREFALTPNGQSGRLAYGDARFPRRIDLPQRFGEGSYGRVDWGESFVEAEGFGLSAAVSAERQSWGPAWGSPLAMSSESGGFAHLRVGTARPVDVWLGTIQLRLTSGRLGQSAYAAVSPDTAARASRFVAGAVGTFTPRGLEALELGAVRLENGPWNGWSPRLLLEPLDGILNDPATDQINLSPNNGFASVFLRFAPPGRGLEVYGELARDDFAGDARWLALEPDDLTSYSIGLARTTARAGVVRTIRAELVNGEISHTERAARTLARPWPPYIHDRTVQGLTNRGQLLGSRSAYGGSAAIVVFTRHAPSGRVTVAGSRSVLADWRPSFGASGGVPWPAVEYGIRVERLVFERSGEWAFGLHPRYVFNRDLDRGRDALSFELQFLFRGW